MKTTFKLIAWLVCFLLAMNFGFECLTASSTIANILGLFILAWAIGYSMETKCFTQFKNNKKDEDNQED